MSAPSLFLLHLYGHFYFPQETLVLPLRTWFILQVNAAASSHRQGGPGAIVWGGKKEDGGCGTSWVI